MSISLVAGLGNPGREYEGTRHNVGFFVIDELVRRLGLTWQTNTSFEVEVARWDRAPGQTLLFAKPLTFMNESGRAVQALCRYYRVHPATTITAYDDLTIDLGLVKVSVSGSAGGHNGVSSLLEHLGSGFTRYRIGIGPKAPTQMDLKDFVLGKFTPEQQHLITQKLDFYVSGLRFVIEHGAERAMNQLNRRDIK